MFRNKIFRKILRTLSDMILVLLVASVGTFLWNHGSDIFNSGNIWAAFLSELRQYTSAYIIILVEFILMGILLYLRQKSDEMKVTKEDLIKLTDPVEEEQEDNNASKPPPISDKEDSQN